MEFSFKWHQEVGTLSSRLHSRFGGIRALLLIVLLLATLQAFLVVLGYGYGIEHEHIGVNVPLHAEDILDKCRLLEVPPGPPPDFYARERSDRFVTGTRPTLVKVRAQRSL